MTDFQGALQKALFDRLSSEITLSRVYSNVPQNTPAPLTVIGSMNISNEGAKGASLLRYEVTIYTEVAEPSRKPLDALQAQVLAALDGWTPAATDGFTFGDFMFQSGSGELVANAEGEPTYFGQQVFGVFVQ